MKTVIRWFGRAAGTFDVLLAPLSLVAALWFRVARFWGIKRMPLTRKILLGVGVFPIVDHYYEPLFDSRKLSAHLPEPGSIELHLNNQLTGLQKFHFQNELRAFPMKGEAHKFHYLNGSFEMGDAELYYSLIRSMKPQQIVEIGGGYSTLIAMKAIERNKAEDHDSFCQFTCVEPYEQPWLSTQNLTLVRKRVEELSPEFFKGLQVGDILFIDSSHIIRPGGDVDFLYFHLLPVLPVGVWIHIHDIFFPDRYPEKWLAQEFRLWNEQYLFEAFMIGNKNFEVRFAMHALTKSYFNELVDHFPILGAHPDAQPGSFWLEKVK